MFYNVFNKDYGPYKNKFWLSFVVFVLVMSRILTYVSDLKNNLNSGYEFTWVRVGQILLFEIKPISMYWTSQLFFFPLFLVGNNSFFSFAKMCLTILECMLCSYISMKKTLFKDFFIPRLVHYIRSMHLFDKFWDIVTCRFFEHVTSPSEYQEKYLKRLWKKKYLLQNVTVKNSPDTNSAKVKYVLILTLENVKCVSWYMVIQNEKNNQCTCTISVFIQLISLL